jgi:hypothetical protein
MIWQDEAERKVSPIGRDTLIWIEVNMNKRKKRKGEVKKSVGSERRKQHIMKETRILQKFAELEDEN